MSDNVIRTPAEARIPTDQRIADGAYSPTNIDLAVKDAWRSNSNCTSDMAANLATEKQLQALGFKGLELINGNKSSLADPGLSHVELCSTDDGAGETFYGPDYVNPRDLNTGRRALGRDVMAHLNDWDWLIEHRSALHRGLETAYSHMSPETFERFIGELNRRSGGNIYMEQGNGVLGSLNPLNPPGGQVVRVYLRRGTLVPDNLIMDSRTQSSGPVH